MTTYHFRFINHKQSDIQISNGDADLFLKTYSTSTTLNKVVVTMGIPDARSTTVFFIHLN